MYWSVLVVNNFMVTISWLWDLKPLLWAMSAHRVGRYGNSVPWTPYSTVGRIETGNNDMDIAAFKRFSSALPKLSGLQVGQVLAQLKTLDSNLQALAALEQGGKTQPACPHCHNTKTVCWGKTRTGLQRRRCKGCLKTFCAITGTTLAGVHKPGLFYKVLHSTRLFSY